MPRLKDCKINVRKDGIIVIRYRKNGYDVSFSGKKFETAKQKALVWLESYEGEISYKEQLKIAVTPPEDTFYRKRNVLFKPFADEYVYNVKQKRVKKITFQTYKNYYIADILPVYERLLLDDITPSMLQRHLDKINERKPRACEDIKMLLNGILQYAVDSGVIDRNPMRAVYIQKHQRTNGSALTYQEERDFVEAIKGKKNEWVFLKMLYSGVRPGEISGIIEDEENNTLTIRNGKLKSYQKNLTRTIPMSPMYKKTLGHKIKPYIYLHDLGTDLKNYLPNHTLKDLRHTFMTRARECRIDNELVAVWTGHSLGNITSSVYTHFSMEHQQKEIQKLNYDLETVEKT